jgi:hypothetical protein
MEAIMAEADALYGLTANELAKRAGCNRWSIQLHSMELKREGLTQDSGSHRPNVTGKLAIVWRTH